MTQRTDTAPPARSPDEIVERLQRVPVGIALIDTELRYLWLNEYLAGLNGHSVPAHIGQRVQDMVPAEAARHVEQLYRQALECDTHDGVMNVVQVAPASTGQLDHWVVRLYPPSQVEGRRAFIVTVTRVTELIEHYQSELAREHQRLSAAIEGARLGMWEVDILHQQVKYNDFWFQMRGFEPPGELQPIGLLLQEMHPDDRPEALATWRAHMRGETPWFQCEYRLRIAGGGWLWVLDRGRIMERDEAGLPLSAAGTTIDITVLKDAQRQLAESESWLQMAQDAAGVSTWEWDSARDTTRFSPNIHKLFGLRSGETIRDFADWCQRVHPEDLPRVLAQHRQLMQPTNQGIEIEYRALWPDGSVRWISTIGETRLNDDGEAVRHLGVNRDVTARKRAELELQQSEQRFNSAFNFAAVPMALLDDTGRFTLANPAMERLLGFKRDELVGRAWQDTVHRDDLDTARAAFNRLAHGKVESYTREMRYLDSAGDEHWVSASFATVPASEGQASHYIHQAVDITRERERTDRLAYEANHDLLTGLYNRREFQRRLKRLVENGGGGGDSVSCLAFMDLDGFKAVNDNCGHDAGDEFLRELAELLQQNVRQRDTLARFGGDEFALLMEHCSLEDAQLVLNKLKQVVSEFSFQCRGQRFQVGVSIGVTEVNRNSDDGGDLLREADAACYAAKAAGRNRIVIYRSG